MSTHYPKVLTLGHRFIDTILMGNNHAEEKVDGSQFNFNKIGDILHVFSKSATINIEYPVDMFKAGVDYLISIQDKIPNNKYYHGEFLAKPKHNVLKYDRTPQNSIIIFDVEDSYGNPYSYEEKKRFAEELGLETVPRLGTNIRTVEDVKLLLEHKSVLGDIAIEGIVIKNYDRITPAGDYMVGKFVSEKYKEKSRCENKENSGKSLLQKLIEELKTEARWQKSVQHLREEGLLEGSPRDIGLLIKEVIQDVNDEEEDYIKERLYNYYMKDIRRAIIAGLPEWYKLLLLENLKEEKDANM